MDDQTNTPVDMSSAEPVPIVIDQSSATDAPFPVLPSLNQNDAIMPNEADLPPLPSFDVATPSYLPNDSTSSFPANGGPVVGVEHDPSTDAIGAVEPESTGAATTIPTSL